MKKYIERMLLTLVGIFLMFTICAAEAHADLLYEPDDDFYEAHREECQYEARSYIADGPDDVLIVYKSPESSEETGRIKNGKKVFVEFSTSKRRYSRKISDDVIPLNRTMRNYIETVVISEYNKIKGACSQ